jgi:hypothetical protein
MESFKLKCGIIDHNRQDCFEKRHVNSSIKIKKNCFNVLAAIVVLSSGCLSTSTEELKTLE